MNIQKASTMITKGVTIIYPRSQFFLTMRVSVQGVSVTEYFQKPTVGSSSSTHPTVF